MRGELTVLNTKTMIYNKSITCIFMIFFVIIYYPISATSHTHHCHLSCNKTCEKEQRPISSIWQTLSKGKGMSMLEKRDAYTNDCKTFGKQFNKQLKKHNPDTTIRFMTYNVHFWKGKNKENTVEPILTLIKKINPDILCLQEVIWHDKNKKDLTQKFKELGYTDGGEKTFVAGKGALGNIIFSKYPLSDLYAKKYKNPVRREYRSFTGGTVLFNNQPIRFYCTHLDVWDETEKTRLEEITELTDHIKNNDADIKNIIFMGDFNAVREEDYEYVVNDKNVWDLVVADDQERTITTSTKALDLVKKLGYKDTFTLINKKPIFTVWSGKIVDFIFVKPDGNLTLKDSHVYYSNVSDHLPVIADFSIKTGGMQIKSKL